MINTLDVKEYLNSFINQDETPRNLVDTLEALMNIKKVVNDRILKIDKDVDFIKKIFGRHDEKQSKTQKPKLAKGAAHF
jgi:hypothetical protein